MTAPPRLYWTAEDLLAAEFPEPRWAIPGVVPEGLTLLAGPPKVGKSWLTYGLAVAVASGGRALVEAARRRLDRPRAPPRRLRGPT